MRHFFLARSLLSHDGSYYSDWTHCQPTISFSPISSTQHLVLTQKTWLLVSSTHNIENIQNYHQSILNPLSIIYFTRLSTSKLIQKLRFAKGNLSQSSSTKAYRWERFSTRSTPPSPSLDAAHVNDNPNRRHTCTDVPPANSL
jgi:hypothetical protein